MNIIKTLIADLNSLLLRIETEVGVHPIQADAATFVKQAATALASHPDAQAAPATPANPDPEAAADPVNSAPEAAPGGAFNVQQPAAS